MVQQRRWFIQGEESRGKEGEPEVILSSKDHPGLNMISLYEDYTGDIWIGTFGKD